MADVDFGDFELFQQIDDTATPVSKHIRFADDEEETEDTSLLRRRLEECDDYIQRLTEESLRRKVNILTQPSGIKVEDVNMDGPILQILYSNNHISKHFRQEIEDSICNVIFKNQKQSNQRNTSSFSLKPQNSAFALDEDLQKSSSSSVKTAEAFKVIGSVLFFGAFSVDKLGQPLMNDSPQTTNGWEVPTYHQVFNQVIGTDGLEIEMKDKRPKSMCFNCGSASHQMRDCPKPKDMAAINERRKEFNHNSNQAMQSNQRYHADEVEERFSKYKPGVLSEDLLAALGIDGNTLPPLIYRMRQLGYPPGWLKEAEMENSGLTLYDGNVSNDSNITNTSTQHISYDVSKLVDFPGFNVPAHKMKDEFMLFGSIPMQSTHLKQNYAAYLSKNFSTPGAPSNKRRHESDSPQLLRKRTRSSPDRQSDRSSDMDVESDPGMPYHNHGAGDFRFQTPLPPGSPCFSSPPPLPHGTPPATPTPPPLPKGTPPPTPTNGSPALRGHTLTPADENVVGSEDDLTLEELEEQQRLIWAALENADTATNSDSETPIIGTPIPSSSSVSTPAHVDTETEEAEEAMDTTRPGGTQRSCENQREHGIQKVSPESPGPVKSQEESPSSPGPVKSQEESPSSPGPVKSQEESPSSPGPVQSQEESPSSPGPVQSQEDSPQSPGPVQSQEDSPQSPGPVQSQDDGSKNPGPVQSQDDSPQSPGPVKSPDDSPKSPCLVQSQDDSLQVPDPVQSQKDSPHSPGPVQSLDDSPQSPDADVSAGGADSCASPKHFSNITAVPHRSKFAAGIVPFEDTPEFTEVAEATGTYLRIRNLLKSSPRSLAKKKWQRTVLN